MTRRLIQVIFVASLMALVVAAGFSRQNEDISPREYCDMTGGKVTETGYAGVYICCYTAKPKCILSNVMKGHSRLILLDDDQLVLK